MRKRLRGLATFLLFLSVVSQLGPGRAWADPASPPPAPVVNASHSPALPPSQSSGSTSADSALPNGVSSDWWTTAQENIRQSEYHITWQDHTALADLSAAYQAPNRAHNLRTYFTPDGIRVIPRSAAAPDWEWGLTLTGYGTVDHLRPVSPAALSVSDDRIEYHRGDLTEWYVNNQSGLEQGFTLQSPPAPGVSSLVLELSLSGNLSPSLVEEGQAIEFTTRGGCVSSGMPTYA
jgi:hypothetical protein